MGRPKTVQLPDYLRMPTFILEDTASCAEVDPELFFPEENLYSKIAYYRDVKSAKAICSECPLKLKCLDYALQNPVQGIWGGLTEPERARLKESTRRRINRLKSR